MSNKYSPGESFAIIVSDPAAKDNTMTLTMFKIYPVNDIHLNRSQVNIPRKIVHCNYYKKYDSSNSSVIFADLDDDACLVHLENMGETGKHTDVLLLGESWNHRSSCPYPDYVENNGRQFSLKNLKNGKKMPVYSLSKKDIEKFMEAKDTSSLHEMKIIVKQDLDNLMKPDSDIFTVDCNELECLNIRRSCPSTDTIKPGEVFLGYNSTARRNVNLTLICRDLGEDCTELLKYKEEKSRKTHNPCEQTVNMNHFSPFKSEKLALRCSKHLNFKNDNLQLTCGRDRDQTRSETRCCSSNKTNIFTTEKCTHLKKLDYDPCKKKKSWSDWSPWSDQRDRQDGKKIYNRYRLCMFNHEGCSYLETEYALDMKRSDRPIHYSKQCGGEETPNCNW